MAFIYISFVPGHLEAGSLLSFRYVTLRFACKQLAALRALHKLHIYIYVGITYIQGKTGRLMQ